MDIRLYSCVLNAALWTATQQRLFTVAVEQNYIRLHRFQISRITYHRLRLVHLVTTTNYTREHLLQTSSTSQGEKSHVTPSVGNSRGFSFSFRFLLIQSQFHLQPFQCIHRFRNFRLVLSGFRTLRLQFPHNIPLHLHFLLPR